MASGNTGIKTREAREIGARVAAFVRSSQLTDALNLLTPVLASRTRFPMLELIGKTIGDEPPDIVNTFLDQIAAGKTEGGWVIIGSALGRQLESDLEGVLERSRRYIIEGDIWYATDIIGERVPGPALLQIFDEALRLISPWREDHDRWVRRTVGVAIHFWAKKTKGADEHVSRAERLFTFLEPMFEERNMDALKGVGWGLKTLGRYYPQLAAAWLEEQVVVKNRPYRALMLRKALTFLPEEERARITGGVK